MRSSASAWRCAIGEIEPDKIDEAVVNLLGMVGVSREEAWELARRPSPELPQE